MKCCVYIDGFNLYFGCLKRTTHRWLNLGELCHRLLPEHDIQRVRYFTARPMATISDPDPPKRHDVYLRALRTVPNLDIHLGKYLEVRKNGILAISNSSNRRPVEFIAREEKGSDVNLATFLLLDGFRNDYELAVVISNDSDLMEPIRVVNDELKLKAGVISPNEHRSRALERVSAFYRGLDRTLLPACQFPETLLDRSGRPITKPLRWK